MKPFIIDLIDCVSLDETTNILKSNLFESEFDNKQKEENINKLQDIKVKYGCI